eukprot:gene13333-biopygen13727
MAAEPVSPVRLRAAHVRLAGAARAPGIRPGLRTINDHGKEVGYDAPAKGSSTPPITRGIKAMKAAAAELAGDIETARTWLPAGNARAVHEEAIHTQHPGLVQGCKVKAYWPVDDAWYPGTVGEAGADGLTRIAYEDGDEEDLNMSKEKYEVVPAAVQQVSSWDAAGGCRQRCSR